LLDGFPSQVLELTSGCICCTLLNNFVTSLEQITANFHPDRIVIEATGVAKATDIARAVSAPSLQGAVRLASTTTMVDARMLAHRDRFGAFYLDQIEAADLIVLNKLDLAPKESVDDLTRTLAQINPRARVVPVVHGAVDRETVLAPRGRDAAAMADGPRPELPPLSRPFPNPGQELIEDSRFVAFDFRHPGRLDQDLFAKFLDDLPWEVFRVKGFVRLPRGTFVLNYTYRQPEMSSTGDHGPTRLAFVAWNVEPSDVLARLKECVLNGARQPIPVNTRPRPGP